MILRWHKRIYLSVPHMGTSEERYVHEAFASNWLSTVGPNIEAFEKSFSDRIGLPSVALGSGTSALHLGLRLLGVGPGDDVIVPTLTFVASVNPVRYMGASPVFVDVDPATWTLDPGLLEETLSVRTARGRRTKAVMPVHLYGQSADMDSILAVCRRYGAAVIEDAAEGMGTVYRAKPCGSFGDVAAFSFNGNKIITTTGGGMLVAKSQAWIDKARFWSTQAREPGITYHHKELGYNYRMSNVLAGIGRGQLEVLEERVGQRRAVAFRYRDAFADLPGVSFMPQAAYGHHTNWLSCFLIDEHQSLASRDEVIAALAAADVEARPLWKPMHLQPLYQDCERHGGDTAESLFAKGLCLPSSSSLTLAEQSFVIERVRAVMTRSAK